MNEVWWNLSCNIVYIIHIKVHLFWEGHKILQVKSKEKISQNFVAFSEYMNFNFVSQQKT